MKYTSYTPGNLLENALKYAYEDWQIGLLRGRYPWVTNLKQGASVNEAYQGVIKRSKGESRTVEDIYRHTMYFDRAIG
jgi:hypothetical protein